MCVGRQRLLLERELRECDPGLGRARECRRKLVQEFAHAAQNVDATSDRVVALAAIGRFQPLHQAADLHREPTEFLGALGRGAQLAQDLLAKLRHAQIARWLRDQALQVAALGHVLLPGDAERQAARHEVAQEQLAREAITRKVARAEIGALPDLAEALGGATGCEGEGQRLAQRSCVESSLRLWIEQVRDGNHQLRTRLNSYQCR